MTNPSNNLPPDKQPDDGLPKEEWLSDEWLTQRLRQVTVPKDLANQLRMIPDWPDEQIDSVLSDVPVPRNLIERCKLVADHESQVFSETQENEDQLQSRLNNVPAPDGLDARLKTIPTETSPNLLERVEDSLSTIKPRSAWVAIAASLLAVLLTVGIFNVFSRLTIPVAKPPNDRAEPEITESDPSENQPQENQPQLPKDSAVSGQTPSNDESVEERGLPDKRNDNPTERVEQNDRRIDGIQPNKPKSRKDSPPSTIPDIVFGAAPDEHDQLPRLTTPTPELPRGIIAPAGPGIDRSLLFRYDTQPIVPMVGSTPLRTCLFPLWTNDQGFYHLEELLAQQTLPKPWQVHVEDFLAALEYDFTDSVEKENDEKENGNDSDENISIHLQGGPNVFGDPNSRLLLVAIQAGKPKQDRTPTTMSIAIDTSSSMVRNSKLLKTQRSLRRLAKMMLSEDRVNLLAFDTEARSIANGLSGNELLELTDQLPKLLETKSGTNLPLGIHRAVEVAVAPVIGKEIKSEAKRHTLVVLTDDRSILAPEAQRFAADRLRDAAEVGIELHLVDMAETDESDSTLGQIAATADRSIQSGAKNLNRELLSSLVGHDPIVAVEARARVDFNSNRIAAYRVLGHETSGTHLETAKIEADLLAGDTAVLLLEIWPLVNRQPNERLATVQVSWRAPAKEPGGNNLDKQRWRQVNSSVFAAQPLEADINWQAATIAAEAANAIRQVPRVRFRISQRPTVSPRPSDGLRRVIRTAESVESSLRNRADFAAMTDFLTRCEQLRVRKRHVSPDR